MDIVIIAIVVLVALLGHWLLFRWVKFKIHEGVILQFLRDAREEGAPDHHHAEAIAAHTALSVERVNAVCKRSGTILADPADHQSWQSSEAHL